MPESAWLRRLVQAHRLHHALRERDDGVSFGFLRAADPRQLRAELRRRVRRRRDVADVAAADALPRVER